ncbi:DUF881 domain-containing protein [Nocardioides jiangxiensis]|uniref:DUF881 domain-containing protein n=1 Tax=Nocardioides jiangxiensis TaxID=3064524 RepID=A0ABT9AZM6_9ACTN|nr:DUF881 domain-containing protein [Nocardioides sp. WY-20]MDO7866792.1 DUF881 domain-containing protein [Nocardioides sp. WY-20]
MPDRAPLPPHVTMPLLDVVIRNSLDVDYQHVAEVRKAAGGSGAEGPRRWRSAAVVAVFGLLLVVAAVQTRASAGADALARDELVRQIDLKRDGLRDANRQIGDLQDQIASLTTRQQSLTHTENSLAARNDEVGALAGYHAVHGGGVKVTLDNAADGSSDGVVRDEDLATLVDGLWAAGAEAIAINGIRLTVTTGIRTAGSAILVHDRALRPPYVLQAVGNVNTLQSRFVETSSGIDFLGLRSRFGFVFAMNNQTNLRLPAAARPDLVRAKPVDAKTEEVAP